MVDAEARMRHLLAGNLTISRAVYSAMPRAMAFFLVALTALAQTGAMSPIDSELPALWGSHQASQAQEMATKRERVRALLDSVPASDSSFSWWASSLAQSYANGGRTAQARAILQNALDRTTPLGQAHPNRIGLLRSIAGFWRQDRNLLQSLACLEKAAAARESAPAPASA